MYWAAVVLLCLSLSIDNGEAGTSRIINGEPADIGDHPYMASLRQSNFHFCGAAIIGKRHILTAAHCIIGKSTSFTVHTGTSSALDRGQVHRVESFEIHSAYNGTEAASWIHDVGVITLKDPIEFSTVEQPVKLPRKDVEDGKAAIITGWGRDSIWSSPEQLQKLHTTLITTRRCQELLENNIYDTQVCAFKSKQTGVCFGDSGSPLVVDGTVVGVTSWIEGDYCAVGYPDVYTKVYSYLDFIRCVVKDS